MAQNLIKKHCSKKLQINRRIVTYYGKLGFAVGNRNCPAIGKWKNVRERFRIK